MTAFQLSMPDGERCLRVDLQKDGFGESLDIGILLGLLCLRTVLPASISKLALYLSAVMPGIHF